MNSSIQIRKLQSFYNAHKNEYAVIAPAYQWAEGLEEVNDFILSNIQVDLNIKLAHKWDAPATLGCDDISLNFTDTMLLMEANWYCLYLFITQQSINKQNICSQVTAKRQNCSRKEFVVTSSCQSYRCNNGKS